MNEEKLLSQLKEDFEREAGVYLQAKGLENNCPLDYTSLCTEYLNLLNKLKKVTKIGDYSQSKLINMQKELQEKNTELHAKITELLQAQKKIATLEREKTILAMAVTANHEINQPLTIIQTSLELLMLQIDPAYLSENNLKLVDNAFKSLTRIAEILAKYRNMDSADFCEYTQSEEMLVFRVDNAKRNSVPE